MSKTPPGLVDNASQGVYIGCMITYRFSTEQRDGRYFIFRDGEKLGAKYGYETERDALVAIEETKRWDRIADGGA